MELEERETPLGNRNSELDLTSSTLTSPPRCLLYFLRLFSNKRKSKEQKWGLQNQLNGEMDEVATYVLQAYFFYQTESNLYHRVPKWYLMSTY